VYVNLFIQSKADIETESNKINVEQTTGYPWDGKISIAVTPEKEQEFALRVRIPGWAQDAPVPTDLSFGKKIDGSNEYTECMYVEKCHPAHGEREI
jgi:DUF1680 family protein